MIIHHMSDGTIRDSIEGCVIPKQLSSVYTLVMSSRLNKNLKENDRNGNSNTSGDIGKQ